MTRNVFFALITGLAFSLTGPLPAHAAKKVGAASIASADVNGTLGSRQRKVGVGDAVFQNEKISTGANARAQILFLDETALNIGPSSTVLLDSHVYDPAAKKGRLVLNAVSGAFRFVSGSGNKTGYQVKTPAGTIGIRGTVVDMIVGRLTIIKGIQGIARFCGRGMPNSSGQYGLRRRKCVTLQPGTFLLAGFGYISDARTNRYTDCGSAYCQILQNRIHDMHWNLRNFRTFPVPRAPSGNPIPNRR